MNSNERFVLILAVMGCTFGLAIFWLPENKAALYTGLPTALVTGALTYLNGKRDSNSGD